MNYNLTIKGEALRALAESIKREIPLHSLRKKNLPRSEDARTWDALLDALVCAAAHCVLSSEENFEVYTSQRLPPHRYLPEPWQRTKLRKRAIEALQDHGLVSLYHRKSGRNPWIVTPLPAFVDRLSAFEAAFSDFVITLPSETIVLIAKEGQIDYEDTEETRQLRAGIERINAFLMAADIRLLDRPHIDTQMRALRRRFQSPDGSARFDRHGRIYGGFWQNMPKEDRALLRIDGEPIADLDFSSMFPRLAYAEAGLEPPSGDIYDCPPFENDRKGIKTLFNAMMFSHLKNWPTDARVLFSGEPKLSAVKRAIFTRHPGIKAVMKPGIGFKFMYTESRILLDVLLTLESEGVTVLPMHDGIMTADSKAERAIQVMREASKRITGYPLEVARKA
jgi:hypothetical protein